MSTLDERNYASDLKGKSIAGIYYAGRYLFFVDEKGKVIFQVGTDVLFDEHGNFFILEDLPNWKGRWP